jgi:hypothetical protein
MLLSVYRKVVAVANVHTYVPMILSNAWTSGM